MSRWNVKQAGESRESSSESRQVSGTVQRGTRSSSGRRQGQASDLRSQMEGARELMKAKRFDDALKAFEEILVKNPEAAPAYVGIGNIYAMRGEYEEALEYYNGALHIKKDLAPALIMSGNVYAKLANLDKALEKYKEALELNPGIGQAQLNVARIYAKQSRFEDAQKTLHEALTHNPQFDEARLTLAGIYQKVGDNNAALKELSGIVARDPDSIKAQFQYAKLLLSVGQFKQAITYCKKAVDLKPESAPMHQLLGRCYFGSGDYELAMREFSKTLDLDPELMMARIGVIQTNMASGRQNEAKQGLIEMSKGSRGLGMVHRLLGDLFYRDGNFASAVAEYKAAILHSKRLVDKYPNLGMINDSVGNEEEVALAYFNAFSSIDLEIKDVFGSEFPG